PLCGLPFLLDFANDDRQVRERLLDMRSAAATTSMETLHGDRLADVCFRNDQAVDIEVMVVFSVGDCRLEGLLHRAGDPLAGELKLCKRAIDLLATDHGGNQVQLLRADAEGAVYSLRLVVAQPAFGLCLRHGLLPLRLLVRAVTVIGTGRSELTELVADHVFVDIDRDVLAAVVDAERQTDELRQDGGTAAPHLDYFIPSAFAYLLSLGEKIAVNKRAFPY